MTGLYRIHLATTLAIWFTPTFSEVRCAAQFLVFYVIFCRPPIIFFCHFSIGYCIVYASSNFPSIGQILKIYLLHPAHKEEMDVGF
jgi:hypothetical protein